MAQITHMPDDDGRYVQVVTPAELRAVLDAEGSDYSRPSWLGPDDEWDVGENTR